jgi:hypothetical protein
MGLRHPNSFPHTERREKYCSLNLKQQKNTKIYVILYLGLLCPSVRSLLPPGVTGSNRKQTLRDSRLAGGSMKPTPIGCGRFEGQCSEDPVHVSLVVCGSRLLTRHGNGRHNPGQHKAHRSVANAILRQ